MPDEVGRSVRGSLNAEKKPIVHDASDNLALFTQAFPAWVGQDGYPLNWRYYVVGLRRAGKARAINSLDTFRAVLMGNASPNDRKGWVNEQESLAGF